MIQDNLLTHIWRIERERRRLRKDTTVLESTPYLPRPEFAGEYTVGDFAGDTSALWKCLILYWFARRAGTLELGTGLGLSTAYLAAGGGDVDSYDICKITTDIADKVTKEYPLARCRVGTFDGALDYLVSGWHVPYNLVYIDGDHEGEALIRYFDKTLLLLTSRAVVIIDDILWSRDMRLAWGVLKLKPEVRRSRKIHDFGILWIDKGRV